MEWFDASGLETFAGDTHGYPAGAWIAPGNWGAHNGESKSKVKHIIMETNDDAIGIFGHGSKGKIYINPTEYLTPDDIDQIRKWREQNGKPKFNYFMVNECDVMSDPTMINAILKLSKEVQGYKGTCVGICGIRDVWDKPVPVP